jgi:putative ABC transport system substrate-binding protein
VIELNWGRLLFCGILFVLEGKEMQTKLLGLLTILLLSWFYPSEAKQNEKIARIGYLSTSSPDAVKGYLAVFQAALQERGYFEGENMVIEERYAAGILEKLPTLVAQLTRLQVNVLVVQGSPAIAAAKKATSTIPIVMVASPDPVGLGHVASLARPGGNITGLSNFQRGVIAKRVELLKQVVPSASRVAVILERDDPSQALQLKELEAAAPRLAVTIVPVDVQGWNESDRIFRTIKQERAETLVGLGDPLSSHLKKIAQFSVNSRLPAIHTLAQFADVGGLMSYGSSFSDLFRRAAVYVDKILQGTKPANLAVEHPAKFELVVNLKSAREMGLTIPPNLLAMADRVIK